MDNRQFRLISTTLLALQAIAGITTLIPQPLPCDIVQQQQFTNLLLNVLMQLLLMISSIPPSPYSSLTLRDRWLPDFHGHIYRGRDVFNMMYQLQNRCKG